ncbi:MAG TPA: ribonuclease III [Candidatus Paceibacterota bacterium]|nr:ribonuclease III [Candidatus Pacearchaeota archaeon]HRZ50535.1 ribonuclease III [Candidatus Paceibacterota bacterium]HSA36256.1 ribonuclease III [Candidatus Paceibacterota bacterium]
MNNNEKNASKDFTALEQKLKIAFKDKNLLTQAFIHRSYLNENPQIGLGNNERLEFLGDAVLELVATEYLYRKYPGKPEGELTSWRAALVNTKMISSVAYKLGFSDFLLLSKGESKEEGKSRQYILANTYEAFIGSLYLDSGYEACRQFIYESLIRELPEIIEKKLYKDSKSRFQEVAQEKMKITPTYRVLEEKGPDHNKQFLVGVYIGPELIAKGGGTSKQEAEEETARIALETKGW